MLLCSGILGLFILLSVMWVKFVPSLLQMHRQTPPVVFTSQQPIDRPPDNRLGHVRIRKIDGIRPKPIRYPNDDIIPDRVQFLFSVPP